MPQSLATAGYCCKEVDDGSLTFHQTIKNEFYASAFRRKLYRMEEIQTDVDAWVETYNAERTHSGKYCYGKTPLQTFIESAPLAHEKQLDRIGHTTDLTTASA